MNSLSMNSLSRGIGPPAPTQPSSSSPSSNHGKGHVLETTSITGDNVYVVVPPKFDEPIVTEPQPKRRKVEISYNSKETPQLIDEEEEEDDILSMEYSRVQHKTRSDGSQDARRTLNALAVDSTESSNRNGRFRGGIPEYKVVEHVMDSRPPKTKRYRVGQEKEGHLDGTSTKRSSLASSETNSVEVLDAGRPQQEAKTLYKGTARAPLILEPSGDINHALHAHSTGKQSPHFLPPTSSRTATGGNGSDEIGGIHEKAIERRGLRFRDENNLRGKWLSSEVNLSSPDELAAAKPSSRELSPVKFAQSASPTKEPSLDLQGSEFLKSDIETGLEKSNIQPSHFTKHGVKTTAFRGPAFQNTHSKEKAATWSMPFASFNFNGETRSSNNLAFVFDESGESLNIHEAGRDIAAQEPSLRLQPRKLQKILWAIKGVKIRFVSSKCGVHDNVLDVEMKSADDITVLLQKLQEGCSIRVLGMASEHMSRLFSHRLSEQQKAPSVSVTSRAAETPTVYLDESRRGLMEAKRPQEDNEQITAKRPRLSDNLRVRDENYTNIQSRDLSPKLKRPPESTDSLTTRRDSDIDNWIERLEQRKYSLRSSNQSNIISQRPRDILSTLELSSFLFFPQEQRFSKLHGLGEQWKKPLTYPMEGKKRTTVDWGDLERLDEGEFLNDNLIAFYLRFLEHKMEQKTPDVARRVYIFNTFFYERLSSTSKGQKGINYPAVQKWTRGVDIYTYDYVVVPVNESAHWYVAIICNLPALNRSLALPEEGHDLPSAPTELTLDRYAKQQGVDAEVEGDVLDSKEIFPSLSPSEQEATASFRAMTLDAQASKDSSPKGLRGGDDGAEKAMLNKLTEPPMDQNDDIRAEELAEIGLGTTDQDIKADDESKATDTKKGLSTQYTRKGKRKSIPPVRTLNPNKPCIITFDSLGSPHFATIRILKDYLQEEARDKRPEMEFDDNELKGMTAKQIPQQDNFCDCGLFLLGYMEKFFDDPKDFITKVVKREYDVKKDWPKLDPSVMRANLRDMLQSLYREQSNNRQVKRQAAINAGKYVGKQQKEPFSDQKHPQNVPNLKPAKSLIVDEKHSGAQEPREAQPEAKAGYGKVLDVERADLHEVLIDDSKVDAGPSLKKQVADTMSTSPVRQAEQQQESLIVLDSQPQPGSLTLSPEKRELNPDIAAPAFEQPSTIEDSQPRRKSPSDDLPSPPPPVVPKRRRRVSRSNPTSPRTIRSPEMQTRASERISSKTKSSPVVGRRPKVIVEID